MSKGGQVWPGMTRRKFGGAEKYMLALAEDLRLWGWNIGLSEEPCDGDEATGMVLPTERRKVATVRVAERFAAGTLDEKRHTILHELLHLVHRDLTDSIRLPLVGQLGNSAYEILWTSFETQLELWTDGMADVMLPMLRDDEYRHFLDR